MRKTLWAVSAAVTILLAGCGSNSNSEGASSSNPPATSGNSGGGSQTITIHASNFEFKEKEIRVKQGDKVKIELVNDQGNHGIEIKGLGVNVKGNGSAEFTADKAGEYEFDCSVMCGSGHGDMVGKIIVE